MDTDVPRKRARSLSSSSASSVGSSPGAEGSASPSPPPKFRRASPNRDLDFICTLPPTCSQPGFTNSFATQDELERHHESYHRWICHHPVRVKPEKAPDSQARRVPESFGTSRGHKLMRECQKVFPEERLLDLHYVETHDPIAKERQSRGEKIFQCFLPKDQCDRCFLTPQKRRRHLIDKHKYPPEYFFAVTNHGLNQIAQQDGLAISMIRPRKTPDNPRKALPLVEPELLADMPRATVAPVDSRDVQMDDLATALLDSLAGAIKGISLAERRLSESSSPRVHNWHAGIRSTYICIHLDGAYLTMSSILKLEDDSPYLIYNGNWTTDHPNDSNVSNYSSSTFHMTTTSGDSVTFTFSGNAVWLYGARRFNHGWYSVYIDSGDKIFIDGEQKTGQRFQFPIYNGTNLADGQHSITLTNECWKNAGENSAGYPVVYLDLDFVMVEGEPLMPGSSSSSSSLSASAAASGTGSSIGTSPQSTVTSASAAGGTTTGLEYQISSSIVSPFTAVPHTSGNNAEDGATEHVVGGASPSSDQCPLLLSVFLGFLVLHLFRNMH